MSSTFPAGTAVSVAVALALAGCAAVGPDYKPPEPPQVADATHPYTAAPLPAQTASAPAVAGAGGAAQRFMSGQDVPAQWWQLYGSEPLDRLVRAALAQNPTLAAAQAALRRAQENYNADAGARLSPSVNGALGVTRQHASEAASGVPGGATYSLYNASVSVSYNPDVFGGTRRELEGLAAAVDYQRYQAEAAYLSLTANLVTAAVQEASLRAQMKALGEVADAQRQTLAVLEKQAAIGAVARQPVLAQRTQLAQTEAQLLPLKNALEQVRHQIAVYAGRLPGEGGLPQFDLDSLRLPAELPVSLPSELVRQRPDVRASESLLRQASAQIGVATANLYPQLTLSASAGVQGLTAGKLFASGAPAVSVGGNLLAPLFNREALQAQRRAAVAAYDEAQAQYRATVLNAFLNVANALRALDNDAQSLRAQAEAEALARQSLELVTRQYQLGAVSYVALLDAQRAHQLARISLVQAQAARHADTAALFQALGGGWWNRGPLPGVPPAGQ